LKSNEWLDQSRIQGEIMSKSVFSADASALAKTFVGELLHADSPGYDAARKVHNGLIDKHPALIARCRGVADVVDAVRFAREHGLELAVRGGGHNVAGHSTTDGGLLLDLSLMNGVQVDAGARIGRAQGGATWGLFNRETQVHGLATTGGVVSTTGLAGLTLGGGLGWLMGRHGLALDNLLSVNLVLADGRALTASDQDNADLFWAVRGGGGNFGVATSFDFRLHPVGPLITGGLIVYPFSAAWDVLRFYRDLTSSLPDDMTLVGGLLHAPDGSKLVALVLCHCGAPDAAEQAVRPIKQFGGPVVDDIKTMSYCDLNTMLDAGYPRGALNYWKSSFLAAVTDDAIRAAIDCFARCPSPMSKLLLEHLHGAVTRIDPADTAFPHRSEGFNLLFLSEWHDPAQNEACIAWTRESYAAVQPFVGANRYVNYLDGDERTDAIAAAYGPNYQRLQQIKAKYDPTNLFHMNQNIPPRA
jgi:FAD/FMN-containing dehydrogenase